MNNYQVRLKKDGAVIFESDNVVSACRYFIQVSAKAEAIIVCPSKYAAMALFTVIRQDEGYLFFQAVKNGLTVKDRKEVAGFIRRAVRYSDLSIAVDEANII